jgi:predicted O-methyltransferase YrrM
MASHSLDTATIQKFLRSLEPTSIEDWERSDQYYNSFLIPKDDVLDAVVKNSTEKGLPDIAVSKALGKFLSLQAKSIGAKRILEVGTLGG